MGGKKIWKSTFFLENDFVVEFKHNVNNSYKDLILSPFM